MQTFLPCLSYEDSAKALDTRRLGKQIVEAYQILHALLVPNSSAWRNHPAVRMWENYERSLCRYGIVLCDEWEARGYKSHRDRVFRKTIRGHFHRNLSALPETGRPWWLTESFCSCHRAALLAKAPDHYSRMEWQEEPCINYTWPVTGPKEATK